MVLIGNKQSVFVETTACVSIKKKRFSTMKKRKKEQIKSKKKKKAAKQEGKGKTPEGCVCVYEVPPNPLSPMTSKIAEKIAEHTRTNTKKKKKL